MFPCCGTEGCIAYGMHRITVRGVGDFLSCNWHFLLTLDLLGFEYPKSRVTVRHDSALVMEDFRAWRTLTLLGRTPQRSVTA
jgi:hypothetical protein